MAEKIVPNQEVLVEQPPPVERKNPGMWASIAMIFVAVAHNVEVSSVTEVTNFMRNLFRMILATLLLIGGGWFVFKAAFVREEELNQYAGVIIGFVTGSALMAVIGFYFGGQDRAKVADSDLEAQQNKLKIIRLENREGEQANATVKN